MNDFVNILFTSTVYEGGLVAMCVCLGNIFLSKNCVCIFIASIASFLIRDLFS